MRQNSIIGKVLLTLLDNHVMSSKKIGKYLGISSVSASSAMAWARKQGYVEHVGYARYQLTDKGKEQVGTILNGHTPHVEVKWSDQIMSNPGEIIDNSRKPNKITTPPTQPLAEEIDWSKEYIILANKLADSLKRGQ